MDYTPLVDHALTNRGRNGCHMKCAVGADSLLGGIIRVHSNSSQFLGGAHHTGDVTGRESPRDDLLVASLSGQPV